MKPLSETDDLKLISMEIHNGKYDDYNELENITDVNVMKEIMKYIYPSELNWYYRNDEMVYGSLSFSKQSNGITYMEFYISSDDLDTIIK